MASTETEQQPFREGGANSGVGSLLKTTRQALGRDLVDVAYGLRIRHTYLMAIEDGRFGDLPGPTYAIGFVRAYAEYLGLDPREVVRRLKMETEGNLGGRNELVFPSPVSEGRFPQGAIIFIGLVLAAVLYTLQLMSSQERSISDMVPSIPESFKTVLNDGQPAPAGEATQPGQGGKSPDEGQVSQPAVKADGGEVVPPSETTDEDEKQQAAAATSPGDPAKGRKGRNEPPAGAAPAAPAMPTMAALPKPGEKPAKPGDAPKPPVMPAAGPTAQVPPPPAIPATPAIPGAPGITPPPVNAPAAVPPSAPPVAGGLPPAPPVAGGPPPVPPEAALAGNQGRVFGQTSGESRIVLRATNDCFIQVREGGRSVITRLLRKGDSYVVPNRSGLTLTAGSAGDLEVMVDGKKTASLGGHGEVRKDLSLDPDKLLAR